VLDDQLGRVLAGMADELRELDGDDAADGDRWVERTRELDHGIDASWRSVEAARESGRLNARRRRRGRGRPVRRAARPGAAGRRRDHRPARRSTRCSSTSATSSR
jgi:hypothetical protein